MKTLVRIVSVLAMLIAGTALAQNPVIRGPLTTNAVGAVVDVVQGSIIGATRLATTNINITPTNIVGGALIAGTNRNIGNNSILFGRGVAGTSNHLSGANSLLLATAAQGGTLNQVFGDNNIVLMNDGDVLWSTNTVTSSARSSILSIESRLLHNNTISTFGSVGSLGGEGNGSNFVSLAYSVFTVRGGGQAGYNYVTGSESIIAAKASASGNSATNRITANQSVGTVTSSSGGSNFVSTSGSLFSITSHQAGDNGGTNILTGSYSLMVTRSGTGAYSANTAASSVVLGTAESTYGNLVNSGSDSFLFGRTFTNDRPQTFNVALNNGLTFRIGTNYVDSNPGIASYRSNRVAPTAITVTASPFNWTNTLNANVYAFVDAGTVSDISINGGSVFTTTGHTIPLQTNEWVTVTYSVAPTMKWKPF